VNYSMCDHEVWQLPDKYGTFYNDTSLLRQIFPASYEILQVSATTQLYVKAVQWMKIHLPL